MNLLLWILQGALSVHTVMGAAWKLSNSEQAVSSLNAIPHGVWLVLIVIELACAVGLLLPFFKKTLAIFAPISALIIAAEMLLFCAVHLSSGDPNKGPMIYWLVVAAICTFVSYGRLVLRPH